MKDRIFPWCCLHRVTASSWMAFRAGKAWTRATLHAERERRQQAREQAARLKQ